VVSIASDLVSLLWPFSVKKEIDPFRLKIHSVHKKSNEGQCQWFTPLFLTTWETEIRMIWVWWQLKEIVQEISSLKSAEQNALEVWFTTPVPWGKMCEETNAIVHETFGSEVYLTNSKVN
jgi:hypothetical protein